MPDISMCMSAGCPRFAHCYRAQATPSPYRQSYAAFQYGDNGCDNYIPMKHETATPKSRFYHDPEEGIKAWKEENGYE